MCAGCSLFDGSVTPNLAMSETKLTSVGTATVNGSVGPTVEKADDKTAEGITGYTVSTLADKKVMVSEKLIDQEITEETRLYVTYKGETRKFGSDLYALLGGTTGGSIEIGSLTFGLIVDGSAAAAE